MVTRLGLEVKLVIGIGAPSLLRGRWRDDDGFEALNSV